MSVTGYEGSVPVVVVLRPGFEVWLDDDLAAAGTEIRVLEVLAVALIANRIAEKPGEPLPADPAADAERAARTLYLRRLRWVARGEIYVQAPSRRSVEPDPHDLVGQILALQRRVEVLEGRSSIKRFATADRPDPTEVRGMFIFNTTTGKHEGSDGTQWNEVNYA